MILNQERKNIVGGLIEECTSLVSLAVSLPDEFFSHSLEKNEISNIVFMYTALEIYNFALP